MTLNIPAAPTEEDARDTDQATQARECIPPLPAGRQEMPRAATGAQPGLLKGKSPCLGIGMSLPLLPAPPAPSPGWGPSLLSCLSFPPARGVAAPAASGSPQPCARGAACRPCPAAGLRARQDTSGSCLFLGVHTSSSQPSIRPRARGVTAQTHKPVGAAAGSPRRRDSAARGEGGADPKTHPTLCSATEPAFTRQLSVPALPTSRCLRCRRCPHCWPGLVGQGCVGQRRPRGVPVPPLPQWGPGCQAQAGQRGQMVLAALWHNRLYPLPRLCRYRC